MHEPTETHHMPTSAHRPDRDDLVDLVAAEAEAHTDDVAELLLGFLVTLPDPTRVREPATV